MSKTLSLIQDQLNQDLKQQIQGEQEDLVHPHPDPSIEVTTNPKVLKIIQAFVKNPLLIQATLNFVEAKQAELALVQLKTLYTDEQLKAMGFPS